MNEINKLFYDDKYYLLVFNKFYQKIKEKNINITKSQLLKFYNDQEISQRFKPKYKDCGDLFLYLPNGIILS